MNLVEQIRNAAGWPSHAINGNGTSTVHEPIDPKAAASVNVSPSVQRAASPLPARVADGEGLPLEGPDDDSTTGLASSPDSQNIVHDVLKGLDVWFKYEVFGIEKEATQQAHSWADHGLPRHDLQFEEPLDVEHVLVGRALEIYWNWIRKARRRVTGAINRELRHLSKALTNGMGALDAYRSTERTLHELSPRKSDEPSREQSPRAVPSERPTHSTTHMAVRSIHGSFWLLMVGLVSAEFVANAPVFTELFPSSIEVERRVNEWLANDTAAVMWLGVRKAGLQLLAAPEPALLAFGVVVFFLFLGHALGEAWRTQVVLARPQAAVPENIRLDLRRQARSVFIACSAGIAITLVVLFLARERVLPMAEERLAFAEQQFSVAEQTLDAARRANDQDSITSGRETLWRALDERAHRIRRKEYATSISRLNGPISGLNFVLVIVAAVAGYFRRQIVITQDSTAEAGRLSAPEPATGTSREFRLAALREELVTRRGDVNSSVAHAELAYARAQQLVQCDPTAQWEAMVERLACVVPTFRAENARLRHLDTRDIKAFQIAPPTMNLTRPIPEPLAAEISDLLKSHRRRLTDLSAAAEQIADGARPEHPGRREEHA